MRILTPVDVRIHKGDTCGELLAVCLASERSHIATMRCRSAAVGRMINFVQRFEIWRTAAIACYIVVSREILALLSSHA
jgi:hypothetical protein